MAKESYNPTSLVIMFNSRHYDMTSIERYVGQSTIAFIYDVAYIENIELFIQLLNTELNKYLEGRM